MRSKAPRCHHLRFPLSFPSPEVILSFLISFGSFTTSALPPSDTTVSRLGTLGLACSYTGLGCKEAKLAPKRTNNCLVSSSAGPFIVLRSTSIGWLRCRLFLDPFIPSLPTNVIAILPSRIRVTVLELGRYLLVKEGPWPDDHPVKASTAIGTNRIAPQSQVN